MLQLKETTVIFVLCITKRCPHYLSTPLYFLQEIIYTYIYKVIINTGCISWLYIAEIYKMYGTRCNTSLPATFGIFR